MQIGRTRSTSGRRRRRGATRGSRRTVAGAAGALCGGHERKKASARARQGEIGGKLCMRGYSQGIPPVAGAGKQIRNKNDQEESRRRCCGLCSLVEPPPVKIATVDGGLSYYFVSRAGSNSSDNRGGAAVRRSRVERRVAKVGVAGGGLFHTEARQLSRFYHFDEELIRHVRA